MKRQKIKIITDFRRKGKYLLIKLMLYILRPVEPKNKFEGELTSVIILAQEKIGDAILLTPLLRNLRRFFPEIEIHVVALSPVYSLFENDPNVDTVYRVKQNYLTYFRSIRKRKFDLLYSTKDHPSFTFLYQSRLIPARFRVGIFHRYHKGFFNCLIPLDFHQHIVEKNCALLDIMGIQHAKEDCRPYLPENKISGGIKLLAKKISTLDCIGINLSAGEPAREWPLQKWVDFLERYQKNNALGVVIFAAGSKNMDKQKLESMFDHVIQSPLTKNIFEVGHILRQLKLLISPDTALIHVASCFNIGVIGLYRSEVEHVTRFYPYLIPNEVLTSPTKRVEDIRVEEVVDAVKIMLNRENKPTVLQKTKSL